MRRVRLCFPCSKSAGDGLELLHKSVVVEVEIGKARPNGELADALACFAFEGGQFFLENIHLGELFGAPVRPVGISRHRQHLNALQAKVAKHVIVTRVIHQRGVAGLQQVADDEFKRLARPLRQQYLAGMGRDAKPGQCQREVLAQWQISERISVF
jgi:hypothetical protein